MTRTKKRAPKGKEIILPAIVGPVTVAFKHEGSVDDIPVGPVIVTDGTAFDNWCAANGVEMLKSGGRLIPWGAKPEGEHRLGWLSIRDARKIAAHYGVELEEH